MEDYQKKKQIVSELALQYGRTKRAIRSRVHHMHTPGHKEYRTVSCNILSGVTE